VGLGAELVYAKRFADHHRFTQQEVLNAINRSKKRLAEVIITTQRTRCAPKNRPARFAHAVHARGIKILSGGKDFQDVSVKSVSNDGNVLKHGHGRKNSRARGELAGRRCDGQPALQRLRQAKPNAHIALLTHEKLADLWRAHPSVNATLTFNDRDSLFSVARRLRATGFDCRPRAAQFSALGAGSFLCAHSASLGTPGMVAAHS